MPHLNWLAILAAGISAFAIGSLWYSPVAFGRLWMSANNFTQEDLNRGNLAKIFGLSFVFAFVMSANLAAFLADSKTTAAWGATAGFLAGFGWVTLSLATVALFERRSWKYILVNGGYMTVSFTVMGLILGAWR
ncbi:MAG TPA: DUF1761 domain-containing protein [Terriglobales bacterium]|nr:DUF1761 domain-containing protein [Terriglobales bacterium]